MTSNRADPVPQEVGSDLRDAARRAARAEGKSLGEWLKALMDDQADAKGVSVDALDAEDRLQALTQGLSQTEPFSWVIADEMLPQTMQGEPSEAKPRASQDRARASAATPETANSFTQAGWTSLSQDDGEGARGTNRGRETATHVGPERPKASGPETTAVGIDDSSSRSTIESKLNTLFSALNRTSGKDGLPRRETLSPESRPEDQAGVAVVAPPSSAVRVGHELLGRTALTSTRTLDQAIAEIAERQALLNRAPPPRVKRRPPAGDTSPPQTAKPKPAPNLPTLAAAPPSMFDSLKGDIARMSQRLEVMHSDAQKQTAPSAAKATDFNELRSLLDRIRPDQSIDALERRVGDLTSKIDKALESQVAPDAFEHLTRRLEHVHASLSDRLSARPTVDFDTGSLEKAVREIVSSTGSGHENQPDVRSLEALMQKLADKLDESHRPMDSRQFTDLQGQVGKLADRIDKSDAGLSAIISVERSLGELFSQMEETRDAAINAAENAARTAAQDALRSAMTESALPLGQQRHADFAIEQVTLDIAELKNSRDAADKRLHAILNALNATLEKVVHRLGDLEADVAHRQSASDPLPSVVTAGLGFGSGTASVSNAVPRAQPLPQTEAAVPVATPRRAGGRSMLADGGDENFLIEPGAPQQARSTIDLSARLPGQPTAAPAVQPDPASFIAAARRAAQAAAQSAQEAAAAPKRAPAEKTTQGSLLAAGKDGSWKVQATGFLARRRRPLLLALAGLVILIGAVQVARLSLQRNDTTSMVEQSDTNVSQETVDTPRPAGLATTASAQKPVAVSTAIDAGDSAASTARTEAVIGAGDPPKAAPPLSPVKPLPTLAMGAAANLAGAKAAPTGLGVGLRSMADDGNASAQYEVGLRLADGRGVARDPKGAADWFEKAAKAGLAPAAYRLGSLYEKGLGVPRDPSAAIQWYEKAALSGNVRAMHNLAVMLAEGANGKSDYVKAASWFSKAAEAGVRDSQFNLAILYARGLGIEQSLPLSYTWFAIAAAQGDADATTKRDEVAQRLDAKALADAKKNAEGFQAAPSVSAANEVTPPPGGWDAVAPRAAFPTSALKPNGDTARVSSM